MLVASVVTEMEVGFVACEVMGGGFVCLKQQWVGWLVADRNTQWWAVGWPPCTLGAEPQLHPEMWTLAKSLTTPCFYNGTMIMQAHCCCGSVAKFCPTLCNPMDCSIPDFPVHHQLQELAQTHVHRVSDAIQTAHPLSSPSPPAFNLSQHQGLFQ